MTVALSPTEQRTVLEQLNLLAVEDVTSLWRQASDLAPSEFRDIIIGGVPELLDPYIAGAADLTAAWYEEAAPRLDYVATSAPLPASEQLAASTRWALTATGDTALTRLAGFTKRTVFNAQRDTVLTNVEQEPGARWARHASANACEFCRMLATRQDVYRSARSAGENNRYHDHCRCMAVPVRPGRSYDPPAYVQQWDEQYRAASRATDGSTKAVLAHMRANN
ncbi:hypothetical protein GS416_00430 [Rhodococcus hoagii]|nr:hypothetical protein [Prescottella equi]